MAMTAHVRYDAIDPKRCASLSSLVIDQIIRGQIGFGGLLMCDDLGMHALDGSLTERMTAALDAGCDVVLHCSGDLAEAEVLARSAPPMTAEASARLQTAMSWAKSDPVFIEDAAARRDALLKA